MQASLKQLALSALLLLSLALASRAADEPAPQPPPDPPAGQPEPAPEPATPPEKAPETPEEAEAGATKEETEQAAEGTEEAAEEAPPEPEGVRRRRPDSAEEEREYKKRKTREDPFLTAPQSGAGPGSYKPSDWLRFDAGPDLSRYLVQDKTGRVLGHLSLRVALESNPIEGEFIHLSLAEDYPPHRRTEVWAAAATLKPRRVIKDNDVAQETESGHLLADYIYDRLTITRTTGAVEAHKRMRALPYSFDEAQLPLLLRQLRFSQGQWPFEAALSQPETGSNVPLSIAQPARVDVIAADGVSYACYELQVRVGSASQRYWVQRSRPHRLVKFDDGTHTWTLSDFAEGK